jgi:hypothetical protein
MPVRSSMPVHCALGGCHSPLGHQGWIPHVNTHIFWWSPPLGDPCRYYRTASLFIGLLRVQGPSSLSFAGIAKDQDLVQTYAPAMRPAPQFRWSSASCSLLLPSPSPRDVVVTAQLLHLLPERSPFASWCCLLGCSGCPRSARRRALMEPPFCGVVFVSGF